MTERNLDLEVLHHDHRAGKFQAYGDPEDMQWLEGRLRGWLQANRWHENRWHEFEIVSRERDRSRVITRGRAAR